MSNVKLVGQTQLYNGGGIVPSGGGAEPLFEGFRFAPLKSPMKLGDVWRLNVAGAFSQNNKGDDLTMTIEVGQSSPFLGVCEISVPPYSPEPEYYDLTVTFSPTINATIDIRMLGVAKLLLDNGASFLKSGFVGTFDLGKDAEVNISIEGNGSGLSVDLLTFEKLTGN